MSKIDFLSRKISAQVCSELGILWCWKVFLPANEWSNELYLWGIRTFELLQQVSYRSRSPPSIQQSGNVRKKYDEQTLTVPCLILLWCVYTMLVIRNPDLLLFHRYPRGSAISCWIILCFCKLSEHVCTVVRSYTLHNCRDTILFKMHIIVFILRSYTIFILESSRHLRLNLGPSMVRNHALFANRSRSKCNDGNLWAERTITSAPRIIWNNFFSGQDESTTIRIHRPECGRAWRKTRMGKTLVGCVETISGANQRAMRAL